MNARLALALAALAAAPAAVSAAQPTTTPSNQPSPKADPPASANANAADSATAPAKPAETTCSGKGYEPRVEHPSAQVGKDTGWIPPKRKRPINADCAQPK